MQITGLDYKIREMASRIRELREIEGISPEEMARRTGTTTEEYLEAENGKVELNFTFLYKCALAFGVDVTDIIEGSSPKLASYTVTKAGGGQAVSSAHGMTYYNMAYAFRNRIAEPLYVRSIYDEEAQHRDIELTSHAGQECDIVVSGNLIVQVGEHKELLGPGDTIYYDSGTPHGMIATGGTDCVFYAIVLNPGDEPIPELSGEALSPAAAQPKQEETDAAANTRIWHRYINVTKSASGTPTSITFKNIERFNFAFDIMDELGRGKPDKLALLHVSEDGTERRFTFGDLKKMSAQCANLFKSMGIRKGDRVLLTLKRHYQFWPIMLGLNKLGAVAIPAVSQLQAHDFEYRFNMAGISAVVSTPDGYTADEIDKAALNCPALRQKFIVNGDREGWINFDETYPLFSTHFKKTAESPAGEDLLLMFFTSGTSGYPKIAVHNHKYPLGHFHTAKYWHCVDPDGLHLTISDTGWAKAMWGKMYGQWLCEAPIFVYDFDRFDASKMLPMFAKYHITTFCAPPTILRMMVKQDISKYDLSSVKHMSTAGEALNPEVYRQFEKATGLKIMEGFGQSESTMIIGNLRGDTHKLGSMGKPAPIYKVALMDSEGNLVGDGENGEIVIDISKGFPCGLAHCYYFDEEATAANWRDGWYHTGDVAYRDEDGFYWYVGRVDDVIKSSGYRIGPFEIESVIMELPYVLECGVSPEPDEVRGQVVKASIVLVKGTEPTEELKKEIQEYVKTHTAPYKYPRIVVFKDELPKTVTGKIMRNKL